MECPTEKLCSRYIHSLLDPSLGPLPADLTALLWVQHLPEGKAASLTPLQGSAPGVKCPN